MSFLTQSFLVIITLVLAAIFAEATPAVGDKSVYDVTLTKGSQVVTGQVSFELTAFDKDGNSWTQISTTEFNGQTQTQTDKVEAKDLLDDNTIDTILGDCLSRGGQSETIQSPAGEFPSCAIPVNNAKGSGTVWVAKVPFGFVKWNSHRRDGITVEGLLKTFQTGTLPSP